MFGLLSRHSIISHVKPSVFFFIPELLAILSPVLLRSTYQMMLNHQFGYYRRRDEEVRSTQSSAGKSRFTGAGVCV